MGTFSEGAFRWWCIGCVVAVQGCTGARPAEGAPGGPPVAGTDYVLTVVDFPSEQRLHVVIEGLNTREMVSRGICLLNWLDPNDVWNPASFIRVGDRTYPLAERPRPPIEPFCLGSGCYDRVQAGERLAADVSYRDFVLPEATYHAYKELSYDPRPQWCETLVLRGR